MTTAARVVLVATTLLTLTSPLANARLGSPCSASDFTSGLGGQDVSCGFACDAGDIISIDVEANDTDASVSGKGACADGELGCSSSANSCSDDDGPVTTAGGGSCQGSSSEFWDSGLTVTCKAAPPADPGPPIVPAICIPATNVCVHSGGGDGTCTEDADSRQKMCLPTRVLAQVPAREIVMTMDHGVASARSCVDGSCIALPVQCFVAEGSAVTCRV